MKSIPGSPSTSIFSSSLRHDPIDNYDNTNASDSDEERSDREETESVDGIQLLILGRGWAGEYLTKMLLAEEPNMKWAATTQDGRDDTIPFMFDPDSDDLERYKALPSARTVLITFPLKGVGQSRHLTELYSKIHVDDKKSRNWIQLGSTGVFEGEGWRAWNSPYDNKNERAIAEDELLAIMGKRACVLNLAGLYGGKRQLRHFALRVAQTKAEVAKKGAVHMIHGRDVARAIRATMYRLEIEYRNETLDIMESDTNMEPLSHITTTTSSSGLLLPETLGGHRFPVTDLHSYDWWALFWQYGEWARHQPINIRTRQETERLVDPITLDYEKWVFELMNEHGIRALPRNKIGKSFPSLVDGRAFWALVKTRPLEGRADKETMDVGYRKMNIYDMIDED